MNELEPSVRDARGTVRLSMPSFFATDVVVPALARLAAQHPTLAIKVDASNRLVDMSDGEADLALRNIRPTEPGLSSRLIGKLGLAMYASRKYLSARGEPEAHDLRGHDLVVYDTGPYAGPGFEWLPEAARGANVAFAANDACALREAARAGLGLTVLPHCIGDGVRELRRVPRLGDGSTEILLVGRSRERNIPRIRLVAAFLSELVRAEQKRLLAPA
jgi:DNA-binding transcriptional LysR family regulator